MFTKKNIGITIIVVGAAIIMVRAFFLRSTDYALTLQILGVILFFGGGLLIPDFTGDSKQKKDT